MENEKSLQHECKISKTSTNILECEPVAHIKSSIHAQTPVLYSEMPEHEIYNTLTMTNKEHECKSTAENSENGKKNNENKEKKNIFNNNSSNSKSSCSNPNNSTLNDTGKCNTILETLNLNAFQLLRLQHSSHSKEIKWKLSLHNADKVELLRGRGQHFLTSKRSKGMPLMVSEHHIASSTLPELELKAKVKLEQMEITPWPSIALAEKPSSETVKKVNKCATVVRHNAHNNKTNRAEEYKNNNTDVIQPTKSPMNKVARMRVIHSNTKNINNSNNNNFEKYGECKSKCLNSEKSLDVNDKSRVVLHIYDLSKGMMYQYSERALGFVSPAIYHSGVVCYGKEFIFEGGIAMWKEGQTRFGNRYAVVDVGYTTKTLTQFMEWIQECELTKYQLSDYDVITHNCHHFTRSAVEFLTGTSKTVPSYLFTSVESMTHSMMGAAAMEVVSLLSHSFQYIATKQYHSRLIERLIASDILTSATALSEVYSLPPTMCVLFRLASRAAVRKTLESMLPSIHHLCKHKKLTHNVETEYRTIVNELMNNNICSSSSNNNERCTSGNIPSQTSWRYSSEFVELVLQSLMHTSSYEWAATLNALRIGLLDLNVCVECISHKQLIPLLLHASLHFCRLLPHVKIALLRVLCNFASFGHGALVLRDEHFVSVWVGVIGMALCDISPAIVYTAACLSLNVTIALLTVSVQSLRNEIKHYNNIHKIIPKLSNTPLSSDTTTLVTDKWQEEPPHPIYRLITIILYHLQGNSAVIMHEASRNMLLHSLLRLMSANGNLLKYTTHHALQIQCDELVKISKTNDNRALLCIIKALHVIHRKEALIQICT